jgi:hypothetical protein
MAEAKKHIVSKKGNISSAEYSHSKGDVISDAEYKKLVKRHQEACEVFDPKKKEHKRLAEHGLETVGEGTIVDQEDAEEQAEVEEKAEKEAAEKDAKSKK